MRTTSEGECPRGVMNCRSMPALREVTPVLACEGGGNRRDRCASYRSEKAFDGRAGRQYIAPASKTCFDGVTNQAPATVPLQVCHAEPWPAGGMRINSETPGLA